MKIFEFINIIADAFAIEIMPDSKTGKVTDKIKYETVLTWFIVYEENEKEAIKRALVKTPNFCNKLLNGNIDKDMPINDASYLKSKISSEGFEDIFDSANLENSSLDKLLQKFSEFGETISEFDVVEDITKVLFKLLDIRSSINKKGSIRAASFIGDNKVQIGKRIIILPPPLQVPNLPTIFEHKYVHALFEVYAQQTKQTIKSLQDLDGEPVYKSEIQLHRERYYSAESVFRQIRELFTDSAKEFSNMKQEIYDAIEHHITIPHKDGLKKLNSTMDLVIKVSFSKSYLSKPGNGLIGPKEKSGMLHMLVNDGKVIWV